MQMMRMELGVESNVLEAPQRFEMELPLLVLPMTLEVLKICRGCQRPSWLFFRESNKSKKREASHKSRSRCH
jgi:hypothetical protein